MLRNVLKVLKPSISQFNKRKICSLSSILLNKIDQQNHQQDLSKQTYESIQNLFTVHNLSKSKKIIQPILENFFTIENKTVLNEFISNPNEWSKFFNNENDLKNFIHLMIIEAISSEQSKLTEPEFFLNLADSLTKYLTNVNLDENAIHLGYLKTLLGIYCTYLEHVILLQKKSPNQIENTQFKQRLSQLEHYLKIGMKKFKNFNEISILDKDMFIRAFSFFETKWSQSTNILMEQPFELNALYTQVNLSNALKGSIRFNQTDTFYKLHVKLNEWNLNGTIANVFHPNQSVFREYFELKGENLTKDLDDLFKAWQVTSYIPSRQVIDFLKEFIQKKGKDYEVIETHLNARGICEVTGKQIPRRIYTRNELEQVADLVKNNMLLETKNEKFLNSTALDEFDALLKKNKFDVVIDGMNVYYHNRQPRFSNIVNMVDLLKNKMNKRRVLVLLKDHLKKSHQVYEKLADVNPDVKCFFIESESSEEDKFVIYASLISATHIISNDTFTNFICRLNYSYDTFKQWLTNRRIEYRIPFNYRTNIKFKMPPVYEMRLHQVGEHSWFIPYFETETKNSFETPNNWIYVERKEIFK